MPSSTVGTLTLLVLVLLGAVYGDPSDFVFIHAKSDCFAHPEKPLGSHGVPIENSNIAFVVTMQGQAARRLCPGQSYVVQVTFPGRYKYLITSSQGSLSGLGSSWQCENRGYNDQLVEKAMYTLMVPCSANATGTIQVRVTSAGSELDAFSQASITLPVDPSCTSSRCAVPPPGVPPPSPRPRPPAMSQPPRYRPKAPSPPASPPSPPSSGGGAGEPLGPPGGCTASTLGYACSRQVGTIILHYSVGGAAPINLCTLTSSSVGGAVSAAGPAPSSGSTSSLLHMAVEASTTGYVSIAWPEAAGRMYPADAVLGWVDDATGQGMVDTFYLSAHDCGTQDVARPSWAWGKGVVQTADDRTIICFSRQASAGNVTATAAGGAGRRLRQPSEVVASVLDLTRPVAYSWAIGGPGDDGFMQHIFQGGFTMDMTNPGAVHESSNDLDRWIRAHAVMMVFSWILLLPSGVLLARHRWLYQHVQKQLWFYLHMSCQWLGMALFIAAFAIAVNKFPSPTTGGDTGKAHKILGCIVMAFAGLQVLVAHGARPMPGASTRPLWNYLHWYLGRLTVLTAWAAVFTGCWIYHVGKDADLAAWVGPCALVAAVMLGTDVGLTLAAGPGDLHATLPTICVGPDVALVNVSSGGVASYVSSDLDVVHCTPVRSSAGLKPGEGQA